MKEQEFTTMKEFRENSTMQLLKQPEFRFGATTFFAKVHKVDTCGSNGLPLTPNSIIIYGKAQILKTINHPNMCQYLDIIRGKHERTVVVSQYCGKPLVDVIGKQNFSTDTIKKIAFQIIHAINTLHARGLIHRNLSAENILLQENNDIKLFNYGLYHMTGYGKLVTFPIVQLLYTAPEVYLAGLDTASKSSPKVDIWSIGMVLAELSLGQVLWANLKLGQKIRKVISLIQCNSSVFERISREHNCYEKYESLDDDLKQVIEECLKSMPNERSEASELLENKVFEEFLMLNEGDPYKIKPFQIFTLNEFYHWWQLVGGDVLLELKKQGLIRSSPPILSLPSLLLIDGTVLGQERNPATLYDPRVVEMPLDSLYERFKQIPFASFYPIIHFSSEIIKKAEACIHNNVKDLPLVIREKDPDYQFHRVILLRKLLHGYPFNRDLIVKEAQKDIPPILRGDIWAALLNVKGDYETDYLIIDKETPTATDRQIEVDIPRCHQYNELLSSEEGHKKLKRILKAWVFKNKQYVYWQGLDSLTAPFLYLNFNNEAKAFACLSAFVPKYLHNFFLKDNSAVIHEFLPKFSQLIAFHDPHLANHLHNINFIPELFAIPWFLTMFSHVFPLHKILHLWDKLLLGDSSFSLHIGLSVLTQLRSRLLSSGFNECILLFSDLPEVDIEKSVKSSLETYADTPRSITKRTHEFRMSSEPLGELDIGDVPLEELKKERCPRISARDLNELVTKSPDKVIIIDIRNPIQYNRCFVIGSINIPFTSVKFSETNIESMGIHGTYLQGNHGKTVIVVGNEETDLEMFPKFLLECNVSRVCILHGGFNVLLPVTPTILTTQNI